MIGDDGALSYAARSTRTSKKVMSGFTVGTVWTLCILGVACLVTFALLPRDKSTTDATGEIIQVAILQPGVERLLGLVLLAGFLLPTIAGIVLLSQRRFLLGILPVVGIIPLCVVAWGIALANNLGPWIIYDSVTAPNGSEYCFIDSSFLQGQVMAIARVKSRGLMYVTLDVMGTTNGDSPRSFLLVVRPKTFVGVPYSSLCVTREGLIAGLRFDNECYLVYDSVAGKFYGRDDVERLSPFLLLSGTDAPLASDETRIMAQIGAGGMGVPTREALIQAQSHPNPDVRIAADRFLSAMKP